MDTTERLTLSLSISGESWAGELDPRAPGSASETPLALRSGVNRFIFTYFSCSCYGENCLTWHLPYCSRSQCAAHWLSVLTALDTVTTTCLQSFPIGPSSNSILIQRQLPVLPPLVPGNHWVLAAREFAVLRTSCAWNCTRAVLLCLAYLI